MNPVCVIEEVSSATQLGSFRTLTGGGVEVLGAPMWPDRAEAPWWGDVSILNQSRGRLLGWGGRGAGAGGQGRK